jgi:hypothetical protein
MLGGRKEIGPEMSKSMRTRAVFAVLVAVVKSASLLAQNDALITGSALNPYEFSEAVVPGVRIVFTAGAVQREVTTDQQGRYEIRLPEAVYQLSGGLPGFCPIKRLAFPVTANTETLINFRLIACGIGDGAEVDKNGKVIREISWPFSPLKTESVRVKADKGAAREVLFEFATRTERGQSTEYKGSIVGRNNISAAVIYGALAVYADSILLDGKSMLRAIGQVTVEDGRTRWHAIGATLNLRASDVIGSVMMEGKQK